MRVTRRLILQKARHQATGKPATPSDCLWARGFRYYFTPLIGVLFTFPSRYSFTIGRQEYLALDGGPPSFPHERPSTWYSGGRSRRPVAFVYGAVTLYGLPFLTGSTSDRLCNSAEPLQGLAVSSYNPSSETAATYRAELGLGYSRFARHY